MTFGNYKPGIKRHNTFKLHKMSIVRFQSHNNYTKKLVWEEGSMSAGRPAAIPMNTMKKAGEP